MFFCFTRDFVIRVFMVFIGNVGCCIDGTIVIFDPDSCYTDISVYLRHSRQ